MSAWQHAAEDIARECEKRFQNGGPRVFTAERADCRDLTPCPQSAAAAARRATFSGETVLARRKSGSRYVWMMMKGNP